MSTAIGHRGGRTRLVLVTGIIAGSGLAALAIIKGIRVPWPGLPPVPGAILGFAAEWVLAVAVATAGVELLRRHHKALASGVWRRARARSEGLTGRLAAWAGPRWERRHAPAGGAGTAAVQAPPALAPVPATIPVAAPAAAAPPKNGDQPMTTATEPIPAGPPMDGTRARAAKLPAPSALWRALAAAAADFVPESEAEAAEWLREQAAGLFAFAEGVMGAHANTVDGKGVDPAAMRGVHQAADILTEAGAQIADGATALLRYFAEVREFRQAGKQMTYDGRWITGEGDD